MKLQRKER